MKELVTETELQQYGIDKTSLLNKFKEQLLKDFEMSNTHHYLNEIVDLEYAPLRENIQKALSKISANEQMQLLYRIDITETQIAKAMNTAGGERDKNVIADLIIRRILQKVILKLIYSNRK
jgi:hypothetical protein